MKGKALIEGTKLERVAQLQELLSDRQSEVLRLYLAGLSMQMIAREMDVTHDTVKAYMNQIHKKYAMCGLKLERKVPVRLMPRLLMDTRPGRRRS
jgi:DNA-binding NarL/FixJ family response regulator